MLVFACNCSISRMLPGEAELVSEWTDLPGRAKSVKRFEGSNGLDTSLYKKTTFTLLVLCSCPLPQVNCLDDMGEWSLVWRSRGNHWATIRLWKVSYCSNFSNDRVRYQYTCCCQSTVLSISSAPTPLPSRVYPTGNLQCFPGVPKYQAICVLTESESELFYSAQVVAI